MAPDGNTVWVANSGGVGGVSGHTVTVLDTSTFGIQSVIGVGAFPEDIAFAHAGSQALVTNSSDATVSVINTATRTATQTVNLSAVPMTFPFGIIASKDSNKVFVTSVAGQRDTYVSLLGGEGGVWVINLKTRSTVTVIPTPDTRNSGVAATPDGRYVLATDFLLGEVSVISTATNQVVANVPVGSEPNDVAITPDSSKAFVTNQGEPTVSVISIPSK